MSDVVVILSKEARSKVLGQLLLEGVFEVDDDKDYLVALSQEYLKNIAFSIFITKKRVKSMLNFDIVKDKDSVIQSVVLSSYSVFKNKSLDLPDLDSMFKDKETMRKASVIFGYLNRAKLKTGAVMADYIIKEVNR